MKQGGKVKFENGLPSADAVLSLLRQRTGLDVRFVDDKGGLYNEAFPFGTEYYDHGNCVMLGSYLFGKDAYLFYATINVLTEMGGEVEYPTDVPDWSRQAWRDVLKDQPNLLSRLVSVLTGGVT